MATRRAAIYYFARNLDKRVLELLPDLLRDADQWVRLYAVMALRRVGEVSAAPMLLAATADPEYTVRVAAVQAIDALKQAEALPAQLTSDPSMHVRAAVATAYGNSSKVAEAQLLKLWLGDASAMVRASALAALASRQKLTAVALLTTAAGDANAEIRATAMSSAAVLGVTTAEAAAILQRGVAGDRFVALREAVNLRQPNFRELAEGLVLEHVDDGPKPETPSQAMDRAPLPAESLTTDTSILTAIGNDYGFEQVFARQLAGKATGKDVFLGITTSGESANILKALEQCRRMDIPSIVFTGRSGGRARELADFCIVAPGSATSTIQELHIVMAHTLCECVEAALFEPA